MNTENQSPASPASTNLAPVYLDNKPISLKDPRPKVSAILSASGKPETTDVKWLQFQPNTQGKALRSEEVLDRTTDPSKPIYLTSSSKGGAQGAGWKGKEAAAPGFEQGAASGGPGNAGTKAARPAGEKSGTPWHGAGKKDDDAGMQGDAEVGGESGRTATTDE